MMKLDIPQFSEVQERQFGGIQFGTFSTADNVVFAARDHHSRWIKIERGEAKNFSYVVKFVLRNGEFVTRPGDDVYRVAKGGSLEPIE